MPISAFLSVKAKTAPPDMLFFLKRPGISFWNTGILSPPICDQEKLLYALLHRCSAEILMELSANHKYLGATPGIIQVLHTWGQELNFHPHTYRLQVRELLQLRRITIRAVLGHPELLLLSALNLILLLRIISLNLVCFSDDIL